MRKRPESYQKDQSLSLLSFGSLRFFTKPLASPSIGCEITKLPVRIHEHHGLRWDNRREEDFLYAQSFLVKEYKSIVLGY